MMNAQEKAQEHVNKFTEYQKKYYNPYSLNPHFLTENEKSTFVSHDLTPVDHRTAAEKTASLFTPYGGLPGQRTSPKSE